MLFWQLLPIFTLADGCSIVIIEIGASEKTDHEWVKIFNRSNEDVDLNNWKFYEDKTNHKLTLFRGDNFIINAGQYAVIAQAAENFVSDYPDFTGAILDSSWGSLSEQGEEIGLKDSSGTTQELFTYVAVNGFILERVDPMIDDYTANNWRTKTATTNPGSFDQEGNTDPVVPTDPNDGQNAVCQNLDLKINEFVSSPADEQEEFIELYNNGVQAIDLTNWSVEDGSKRVTMLTGEVESGGFFIIDKPKGVLNNDGDLIVLRCAQKIIDQVAYGEWNDSDISNNILAPEDPYSAARTVDGQDSDVDSIDWQVTTNITRGAANIIITPPSPPSSGRTVVVTGDDADMENDEAATIMENSLDAPIEKIIINEIFPNPAGIDREKEFIELKNIDIIDVDLDGWIVSKGGFDYHIKKDDFFSTVIPVGGLFVLPRKVTNIALKNTGKEVVSLENTRKMTVDKAEYSARGIEEEWSYSLFANGWQWTLQITPEQENVLEKISLAPLASLVLIKNSRPKTGEKIIFDATDSTDPDGDALDYRWNFGDENFGSGEMTEHVYASSGKYEIVLTVDDGRGKSDILKKKITIYPAPVEEKEEVDVEIAGSRSSVVEKASATNIGKTMKTSGEVIEKNGQKIWLDDNGDESLVYISKTLGIKMSSFSIGQKLEVTGVVKKYQDEYRICPRDKNDIIFINNEPQILGAETTKQRDDWVKLALIGGMIIVAVVTAIIIKIKNKISK